MVVPVKQGSRVNGKGRYALQYPFRALFPGNGEHWEGGIECAARSRCSVNVVYLLFQHTTTTKVKKENACACPVRQDVSHLQYR